MLEFVVRPFRQIVERGANQAAIDVTGAIGPTGFVFGVDGASYSIPTVRRAEDEHGPFVVLQESTQQLPDGFHLVVEVDPVEFPFRPGCTIRLFKPNRNAAAAQEMYPGAILLLPVDASLSISFGPGGNVNGWGVMTRPSASPEARH